MNVNWHCFILRTTTVAGLGVPIFRVITVLYTTLISEALAQYKIFRTKVSDFLARMVFCIE